MPRTNLSESKSVDYAPGGMLSVTSHSPGEGMSSRLTVFDQSEARKLWQATGEYLKTCGPQGATNALLMGGPKHGEFVSLEGRPHHIEVLSFDRTPIDMGPGREPAMCVFSNTHIYFKCNDYADGKLFLPFDIFEHESLADEHPELKAQRLDADIARADNLHARLIREANSERMKAAAAIEDREKAAQKRDEAHHELDKLIDARGQLTFEFGV